MNVVLLVVLFSAAVWTTGFAIFLVCALIASGRELDGGSLPAGSHQHHKQ